MKVIWAILALTFCAFEPPDARAQVVAVKASHPEPVYVSSRIYDPGRNAEQDIRTAIAEARRTGKRILLDVGGDWCPWCHLLDEFFHENPDLVKLRERNFITVMVCYGPDNRNDRVLARYSPLLGVPHFFVLDKDGTLLHSQHVVDFEQDGSYNADRIKDFLIKWSPASYDDPHDDKEK